MPYMNGKNARLYMVCENPSNCVKLINNAAAAAAADALFGVGATDLTKCGVGALVAYVAGDASGLTAPINRIRHLEGVDYKVGMDEDTFHPFGSDLDLSVTMRKNWEINITRKTDNPMFKLMYESARMGVQNASTLHDGTMDADATIGYRFILFDGLNYMIFAHGFLTPDGYSEKIDPGKLNVESLTFKGNYYRLSAPTAELEDSIAVN